MRSLSPSILVTVPTNAAGLVVIAALPLVQICVPSANRAYSPFELLPRSIRPPVGLPLPSSETVPRVFDVSYIFRHGCQALDL